MNNKPLIEWWHELPVEVRDYLTLKYYGDFVKRKYPEIMYPCNQVMNTDKIIDIYVKEIISATQKE